MIPQYGAAITDIRDGLAAWQIWGRLGWREARLRYQRTVFGPFWTTLSLGIFVTVMGIIWSQLWKIDTKVYIPFLTSGMITWMFFSAMTNEGCATFISSELLVKQLRVPYTMLAASVVWRNLIVFFHNFIIFVFVIVYAGITPTWAMLLVIPGLILLCLNGLWISLFLGLICARYRDIQQLVQNLLQISMFLTPIFWSPEQLQGRRLIFVHYNLLHHYIELVRAPLLGKAPEAWSWIMVIGATIVGWVFMLYFFSRFRRRLAYWV